MKIQTVQAELLGKLVLASPLQAVTALDVLEPYRQDCSHNHSLSCYHTPLSSTYESLKLKIAKAVLALHVLFVKDRK